MAESISKIVDNEIDRLSNELVLSSLSKFFGTPIQQRMIGGHHRFEVVQYLNIEEIRSIVPESAPQLYLEKAVLMNVNNTEENYHMVIATVPVTASMCQGHFEWFPMVPLALVGQASAQIGGLATLWISQNMHKDMIPLVIQVKNIKSISEKRSDAKRKDVAVPGDILIICGKYLGGRFGIHKTELNVYVDCTRIAHLQELDTILVNKEEIIGKRG